MTAARSSVRLAYAAVIFQTCISAGTYLCAKRVLHDVPWPALVLLRNLGATALFIPIFLLTPGPVVPTGRALKRALLLGLLGVPLNQALFLAGLSRTTPSHAALLYTLTPLFVLGSSVAARQEKLEARRVLGLGLALAGAAIVVLERSASPQAGVRTGDLLILGAVVAWAGFTVLGRPLIQEAGPLRSIGWSLIAGMLMFLPFSIGPASAIDFAHLPTVVWGALAFLVVMTSVVSYFCWYFALGRLEPSRVAVFTNLQPVATAAASWVLFAEPVTPRLAAGGLAVIAGVVVATRRS